MRNTVTTRQNQNVIATLKLRSRHKIEEATRELCCDLKYQCCDMVVQGKITKYCRDRTIMLKPRRAEELEVASYDCILAIATCNRDSKPCRDRDDNLGQILGIHKIT